MPVGIYKRIEGKKYGMSGKKHSKKTLEKMSGSHKGRVVSEEQRKKMSLIMKGRIISNEWRRKIALSNTKEKIKKECINCSKIFFVPPSLNTRKYCSKICGNKKPSPKYWLGKKRDKETIQKLIDSHKGKSPWNKGKKYTEEEMIGLNKKGLKLGIGWNRGTKGLTKANSGSFKKGHIGRIWTEEEKKKHSIWKINNPNRMFKDTKIELKIEQELKNRNISYEKQKPLCDISVVDFYLPENNIVIQADGCYWHGCEEYKHKINKKITKNMIRDRYQNKVLISQGYRVYHFWEHDINRSVKECIDKITW